MSMETNEKTKFIYMGDSQCAKIGEKTYDYSGWQKLLDHACALLNAEQEPTQQGGGSEAAKANGSKWLLVSGGDVVNNINSRDEWRSFFDAFNTHKDELKMIAANGNHLRNRSYSEKKIFSKRVKIPDNGPAGMEKRFYSYDYGCVHFTVLDSNFMGNGRPDVVAHMRGWIEHDLAESKQPVSIIVMHHPMFVIKDTFNDYARAELMRRDYLEVFDRYGVDFILCGHQHVYARSKAFNGNGKPDENGMIQLMGVSGTKVYDDKLTGGLTETYTNQPVATVFETDGQTIWLTTINETGEIVDTYAKVARPKPGSIAGKVAWMNQPFAFETGNGIRFYGAGFKGMKTVGNLRIRMIRKERHEYSVLRMGETIHESWEGYSFAKILAAAGWKPEKGKNYILRITSGDGITRAMKLDDLTEGKLFKAGGGSEPVPALIIYEEEGYRMVCGQRSTADRNIRRWIRRISEIEIAEWNE